MKTTAAMDAILAENILLAALHARECAVMSLGGFDSNGRVSTLFDERPMGWKAGRRVDPSVVPPIERAQWARQARTFVGSFATQPVPGHLEGDELLTLAEEGLRYAELVVKHGSPEKLALSDAY